MGSQLLFALGVTMIGMGAGMFAHGTLTATMELAREEDRGLALGAWGASQASAAGLAIALSGTLNDYLSALASRGALGEALVSQATSFACVYVLEIILLFATVIAIGPLVRGALQRGPMPSLKSLDAIETGGSRS
jgi:BCD family chlorophyll transporter-like MFS transporter